MRRAIGKNGLMSVVTTQRSRKPKESRQGLVGQRGAWLLQQKARGAAEPIAPGKISPRIGSQLKRQRRLKGLRLKDVAERAGISQSLISKIENNKASPSLSTLH